MDIKIVVCVIFIFTCIHFAVGCTPDSGYCLKSDDCCNNVCTGNFCGYCKQWGGCSTAAECCSNVCTGGICTFGLPTTKPQTCFKDGDFCLVKESCCSKACTTYACGTCKRWGQCKTPNECCSQSCSKYGYCDLPTTPKPCSSEGTKCTDTGNCCTNLSCNNGFCRQAESTTTPGPCLPDGATCDSGCKCCSKVCTYQTCGSKQ